MSSKSVILHLSVVHFPYDPRVVYRESFSTSKRYRVAVVIPNADQSLHPDIDFISIPFFVKTWLRILFVHPLALWYCIKLRPSIIHFHDAELLPIALLMRLFGKKVIYDIHENVRKQWAVKKFNTSPLLRFFFQFFDQLAQRYLYIILAEKSYLETYQNLSLPHQVIYNYPKIEFFEPFFQKRVFPPQGQPYEFFYIGQISMARGIDTLIEALSVLDKSHPNFIVHLVGGFEFDIDSVAALEQLKSYQLVKDRIKLYGKLDPSEAFKLSQNALGGIALLKDKGDSAGSYPTKIFEYMALGMPVITSHFKLYQDVVNHHDCGFCINPTDHQILADTLIFLIENPQKAYQMGVNGCIAVQNYYNWQTEEAKLFDFYEMILQNKTMRANLEIDTTVIV